MQNLENKYYPNGKCPVCGGQIILEKSFYKYICYNCNAHSACHKKDGPTYSKYMPRERFAGNSEHNLRKKVRMEFSKLFMERRYVTGEHETFRTSIVNVIYPLHLVKRYIAGEERFYESKKKDGGTVVLMDMDNGEITTLPIGETSPVSNREKAMVYVAQKMGLETAKAHLGFMDRESLDKANRIITAAVLEARKKSLEYY